MFYALKDDQGRYIQRSSTFSGGYFPYYTLDIKYARIWDYESDTLRVAKNWNNHLDKMVKKNTLESVYAHECKGIRWGDTVRTNPTKVNVVELSLSEIG